MALLISGLYCEIREIKLSAKPEAMLAASPKGTVPVLVLTDGHVLEQSLDIMRWTLSRHDPEGWLARDSADLIATNDGPFKHHLDRFKYFDRDLGGARGGLEAPKAHQDAAMTLLRPLETRLSTSLNLCGEQRGLTDIAIIPFVRQFAQIDRLWFDAQPIPHVRAWLERHVTSPLFAEAMVRLKVWQPSDDPLLFGPSAFGLPPMPDGA